jgi:hypothetical protein
VFVSDVFELVPASVRRQLESCSFDFKWPDPEPEERRRRTKAAGIVAEVKPPGFSSDYARYSYAPFVQLIVAEEDDNRWDYDYIMTENQSTTFSSNL